MQPETKPVKRPLKIAFRATMLLLAGLLVAALTAAALAPPGTALGKLALTPWDKASHFAAFLGLTLLLGVLSPRNRLVRLGLLLALFGLCLEFAQGAFGRTVSAIDFGANLLGIAAGAVPLALLRPDRRRTPRARV